MQHILVTASYSAQPNFEQGASPMADNLATLTIETSSNSAESRRVAVNLANLLNSTGVVLAQPARDRGASDPSVEFRSPGLLLYTLSLSAVRGATVRLLADTLVNGVRAAFASAKNKDAMNFKLTVNGREIQITAKNLTGNELDLLTKVLEAELGTT